MKRIEPNIIETSYYTLVSANEGVGKTFWCKRQIAKTLRTISDRIIVFDVTGEYADFVLDHDRIVPGRIPMILHQYKITDDKPVVAHTIEVDMAMGKQPQLIVHDVSRTMTYTWHKGVLAITASLIHYLAGREHTKTWLFLNLDPYSFEDGSEPSWTVLERFVKQHGQEVKPVFTSRKLGVKEINRRLNIKSRAGFSPQLPLCKGASTRRAAGNSYGWQTTLLSNKPSGSRKQITYFGGYL